jgi:hypothetical protein
MVYIIVNQTVEDYNKWRPIFDSDDARRRTFGSTGHIQIYRDETNPNNLSLVLEWDSLENANKFLKDPVGREVMQKAGVNNSMRSVAIYTRA